MSRSPRTPQFAGSRLIGSTVAFLLLCGAALLGGVQKPKIANPGPWYSGPQAPLVQVFIYPNDCQRNGEARWRNSGEGDDQPDQLLTLDGHSQPGLNTDTLSGAVLTRNAPYLFSLLHHPQAARAPPVA
ncbi:MAG: hypothetical protein NVV73_09875 [Cellvibrionaceae bacterium]|nr:hypothetical protein [Cellvibrionaceae bacterium]